MESRTEYLPDEITYGFVADQILHAIRDTDSDDDRFPDGVPAQGTVRFSPERRILYTQQHPATVLLQDIECTIYHREHPIVKERSYEPEHVGKLVDPTGHIGNVALIVGWYEVVYNLSDGTAKNFSFEVKPEHTEDNPLWLPSVAPLDPTPSERFVVNEQVYNDTKQARDETVSARDEVLEAYDTVLLPVQVQDTAPENTDVIWVNPDEPAGTASDYARRAEEMYEATKALGITVDTSVGTRVFVGDTLIHGDTGNRDVTGSINTGVGWFGDNLTAKIQRTNNTVSVVVNNIRNDGTGTGNVTIFTLPIGFRANDSVYGNTTLRGHQAQVRNGHTVVIVNPSELLDYFYITFTTDNPWPTSLPGSPV